MQRQAGSCHFPVLEPDRAARTVACVLLGFLGGQPADVAQGTGRSPLLCLFISRFERASRGVGGGAEVGQARVRERGPENLENVCPYHWARCPWEPGLPLMGGKVIPVKLDPGKESCL